MKYENADDIFPEALMVEIRKYMAQGYFYVASKDKPKAWGSLSGERARLLERNKAITLAYQSGKSIEELSRESYLSKSSIYRIIKQNN